MEILLTKQDVIGSNHYHPAEILFFRALFKILQIFPPFAAGIAYRRFFRPRKYRPRNVNSLKSHDLPVNNLRVRVYEGGEGPCILVAHGWESSVASLQLLLAKLILKRFRVVSFDMPAHGHSSARDTDIVQITDIIMTLAEVYGPFDAAIGHSFGGVCLASAIRRKLNIAQLVLISTPSGLIGIINKFCRILGIRRPTKTRLTQAIAQRLDTTEIERDFDVSLILQSCVIPTLLIHDLKDRVVPFAESKELSGAHTGIELFVTDCLGHSSIIRDVQAIDKCIAFISKGI